jgi:hypothetical protein
MVSALLRILFGFIVACLIAGVATVAFVVTPADIAGLSGDALWERLGYAGVLSLQAATHSSLFAIPFALIAIAVAEWQAVRSWLYYVIVGLAIAVGGFVAEYLAEVSGEPTIVNDYAIRAYLTVGFVGGLAYWLFAGRLAGGRRAGRAEEPEPAGNEPVAEAAG